MTPAYVEPIWLVVFVSIKYPPWFPHEIRFQIPYQKFSHLAPCIWCRLAFHQYFKSNANIGNILCMCVSLQGILIFSIDPISMINFCWHFNAILVCRLADTILYLGYNDISLVQSVRYPPRKGGIIGDVNSLENSAVLNECNYFISFRSIRDSEWSTHFTSIFQPTVVFLWNWLVTTYM